MYGKTTYLTLPDRKLAYQQMVAGKDEGAKKYPLMFLGGYASDMTGTKATFLAERCRTEKRGFLSFDYRGHGQSDGDFVDGTIGDWFEDALAVFNELTQGPQILIGSSMGGWIGLLLAKARPERVAGFIGIAAAPDFTEELVVPNLTEAQKAQLIREGLTYEDGAPVGAPPITQKLINEAKNRLVLSEPITLNAPVRLLQGQRDNEVPWTFALKIMDALNGPDVRLTLIKDGDHRLSRESDLKLLWETIGSFDRSHSD